MAEYDWSDPNWRATLGTVRCESIGDTVRAVPDFTIAMASDLVYRELPEESVSPGMFDRLFTPGTQDWSEFFSTRKVVHRYDPHGARYASVTSNVVEALEGTSVSPEIPTSGRKPKEYEVVHLLTDVSLKAKFGLEGETLARMRNMAVVQTDRAARMLQSHIRGFPGSERAVVKVGKYAGSWKAARDCIKQYASRFSTLSVHVDACAISDKIFFYGPQGTDGWRVFGPLSCAALVHAVHKMVVASSCEAVIFAFGMELTLLDIDIHDGQEVMCPVRECHAGDHGELPYQSSSAVGAMFSADGMQRLRQLCESCETFAVDGQDVATAVRITGRYVLVNAHVLREMGSYTANAATVVPHRMVSSDLWLARSHGEDAAWALRQAEVGELVILCYRRHNELQFLGPVRVKTVAQDTMSMGLAQGMLPGMSGAAIVATRDFALLGLYDGVSMRSALGATFSPEMFTEINTMSEMGDSSHVSARDFEGSVYSRLKDRGLSKFVDAAMAATVPLYSRDTHVGMGVAMAGRLYTTCDPNAGPLQPMGHSGPMVFHSDGSFFSSKLVTDVAGPAVVRPPSYGEKVFVVGKDSEGDYVSSTSSKVVHIGVGASWFKVGGVEEANALPLQGGLIVAEADAAVLGVYKTSVYDKRFGNASLCLAMPKAEVPKKVEERPEASLARIFPFLRPATWPEGVARAVLSHASTGASSVAAYAMVGDSALRSLLWVRLLEAEVPTQRWQTIFGQDQCNAKWAAVSEKLGLAGVMRVGHGTTLTSGCKPYADVLEAVAGAVFMYEPASALESYALAVGAIREDYDEEAGNVFYECSGEAVK